MALVSYECNVISHRVSQLEIIVKTRRHIPPRFIQIELTIDVDLLFVGHDRITGNYTTSSINPFSSQETLRFVLNLLQNRYRVHQVLAPTFTRLRINAASTSYDTIVHEIIENGLRITDLTFNRGYYCKVLPLHSEIRALVAEPEINQEINLMTRALAESASEFESSNYGMVAAKESSVNEMLKRVKVEAEDEVDCMICLEELRVGLDASRMPCSHTFHSDCIEIWLKQSYYCLICRFEMPTN